MIVLMVSESRIRRGMAIVIIIAIAIGIVLVPGDVCIIPKHSLFFPCYMLKSEEKERKEACVISHYGDGSCFVSFHFGLVWLRHSLRQIASGAMSSCIVLYHRKQKQQQQQQQEEAHETTTTTTTTTTSSRLREQEALGSTLLLLPQLVQRTWRALVCTIQVSYMYRSRLAAIQDRLEEEQDNHDSPEAYRDLSTLHTDAVMSNKTSLVGNGRSSKAIYVDEPCPSPFLVILLHTFFPPPLPPFWILCRQDRPKRFSACARTTRGFISKPRSSSVRRGCCLTSM